MLIDSGTTATMVWLPIAFGAATFALAVYLYTAGLLLRFEAKRSQGENAKTVLLRWSNARYRGAVLASIIGALLMLAPVYAPRFLA